jgi:hypothetical protein
MRRSSGLGSKSTCLYRAGSLTFAFIQRSWDLLIFRVCRGWLKQNVANWSVVVDEEEERQQPLADQLLTMKAGVLVRRNNRSRIIKTF